MKYIKYTYVDSGTNVPVNIAPAANGPKIPDVIGLEFVWARQSQYPTLVPEFFGTCPDDSDTNVPGVLGIISEVDWEVMRNDEMRARIPSTVTPRQARLALLQSNLLDQVTTAINSMPEPDKSKAEIEWEYAVSIERNSDWVNNLGTALGLTAEDLDNLFTQAATL